MAILKSGASSDLMTIGATSKAAYVEQRDASGNPVNAAQKSAFASGGATHPMAGLNDDTIRLVRVDRYGSPRADEDTLMFWEPSEGAALNTQRWKSTATTMTASQTAVAGILLNASAITTTTTGILLTSQKAFPKFPGGAVKFTARHRFTTVANQVWELGLANMGTLSGTTAQVDNGVFWRFTGTTVVPVLTINGSDVETGTDILGSLASTNYYTWDVILDDDRATYTCQRSDTGAIVSEQVLRIPLTNAKMGAVTHLNAWYRLRNAGVPASAGQTWLAEAIVTASDYQSGKTWPHQLANLHLGQEVSPTAFTATHTFANSAWPTTATLSNTAASYATLGGLWTLNAAVSAATDNSFFSFAVPAPYSFYCTGVHLTMMNTGAANAATPASTLFWGLGVNGASANLSTGGHMRVPLGQTSIPISAAIGAASPDVDIAFDVPLVTEAGKHITVIMRIVGGAATASQVWQGSVGIRGFFE